MYSTSYPAALYCIFVIIVFIQIQDTAMLHKANPFISYSLHHHCGLYLKIHFKLIQGPVLHLNTDDVGVAAGMQQSVKFYLLVIKRSIVVFMIHWVQGEIFFIAHWGEKKHLKKSQHFNERSTDVTVRLDAQNHPHVPGVNKTWLSSIYVSAAFIYQTVNTESQFHTAYCIILLKWN